MPFEAPLPKLKTALVGSQERFSKPQLLRGIAVAIEQFVVRGAQDPYHVRLRIFHGARRTFSCVFRPVSYVERPSLAARATVLASLTRLCEPRIQPTEPSDQNVGAMPLAAGAVICRHPLIVGPPFVVIAAPRDRHTNWRTVFLVGASLAGSIKFSAALDARSRYHEPVTRLVF